MSSPAEAYLALCKEQLRNFPREQARIGVWPEGSYEEGIFGRNPGHVRQEQYDAFYGDGEDEEDPQRELLQEGLDLIRSLVRNLNASPLYAAGMYAAGTGAPPVVDQLVQDRLKAQAELAKLRKERGEVPLESRSIFAPDDDERPAGSLPDSP